jgi:hypothetical protein
MHKTRILCSPEVDNGAERAPSYEGHCTVTSLYGVVLLCGTLVKSDVRFVRERALRGDRDSRTLVKRLTAGDVIQRHTTLQQNTAEMTLVAC